MLVQFSLRELKKKNVRSGVLTELVMNISIQWDITPCSPLKMNQRFGGTHHLLTRSVLISCLEFSLTLKMKFSSETSDILQRT
jgi:hypothetical protein